MKSFALIIICCLMICCSSSPRYSKSISMKKVKSSTKNKRNEVINLSNMYADKVYVSLNGEMISICNIELVQSEAYLSSS